MYLTDGHVRLVGSTLNGVGAVELLYPQVGWTGICADEGNAHLWESNTDAAEIVCRQLGYEGGRPYVKRSGENYTKCAVNPIFLALLYYSNLEIHHNLTSLHFGK